MNGKIVGMVITIIIITIFVAIQQSYFDLIFQSNNHVAYIFQKLDSPIVHYYLNTIQLLGTDLPITLLLVIVYELSSNKNQTFMLILLSSLGGFLNPLLKMLHGNPRPYMVYLDNPYNIEAKECSKEYGNPSGHSFIAVFALGTLIYLADQHFRSKVQQNMFTENDQQLVHSLSFQYKQSLMESRNRMINIKNRIVQMSISFIIVSILFNRVFNFTHSYGQVIYGSLVGLFFIFWFQLIKDFPLNSLIIRQCYRDQQQRQKTSNYLKLFIICSIMMISSIYISFVMTRPEQYLASWVENMSKCMGNDEHISTGYILHGYCLAKMSILYLSIGLVAGIFGQKPVYNTQQIQINSKYRYYQISWLRLIVQILVCGVLYCPIWIVKRHSYVVQHVVNSVVFLVIGVNYTLVLPWVYLKLGIVQKDDFYILQPQMQTQLVQYQLSYIQ